MDDLMQWFGKQLDIDAARARAATPGPWRYDQGKHHHIVGTPLFEEAVFAGPAGGRATCEAGTGETDDQQSMRDAEFIAEHGPDRALREIDAKRKLIARGGPFCTSDCDEPGNEPKNPDTNWTTPLEHHLDCAAYNAAGVLAMVYTERPGYREEWRP